MSYKTFAPGNRFFSITVPEKWEVEEDDGTFTFSDPKDWKGNFRLTPFTFGLNTGIATAPEFLLDEMRENPGAVRQRYADLDGVHYVKHLEDGDDRITIFYYTLGFGNYIFLFSFTVYRDDEKSDDTRAELVEVKKAMNSLVIDQGHRG